MEAKERELLNENSSGNVFYNFSLSDYLKLYLIRCP